MPKGHRLNYQEVKKFIEIESASECKLLSETFTGHMQKLQISCKCGNSFYRDYKNFRLGHYYCEECKSKNLVETRSKTHGVFLEDIYNVHNDEFIVIGNYINNYTKIRIKHNTENCSFEWCTLPSSLLKGHGCPLCSGVYAKDTEFFNKQLYEIVKNEYTVLSEYEGTQKHVKIKHNVCNNIYETTPSNFLMGRRCPFCSGFNRKIDANILRENISQLTNGEYELLSEYKNSKEKIQLKHAICNKVFDVSPSVFLSGSRCPYCSYRALKSSERYAEEFQEKTNEKFILLSEYVDSKTKVNVRHTICGYEFEVNPTSILTVQGCKKCGNNYTKTQEEVFEEVKSLTFDKYQLAGIFKNGRTRVKYRHLECGNFFEMTPHNFNKNNGCTQCPVCYGSSGESKIHEYLLQVDVNYIHQFSFLDCRNILPLLFDFAILNENDEIIALIEYDGEQHYKPILIFGGIEKFEKRKINDLIKNIYCEANDIPLIRIPYWDFDNIETILKTELIKYDLINNDILDVM